MKNNVFVLVFIILILLTGCDVKNENSDLETSEILESSNEVETTTINFVTIIDEDYEDYSITAFTTDMETLSATISFKTKNIELNIDSMKSIMNTFMIDYKDQYKKISFAFGVLDDGIALIDIENINNKWEKGYIFWTNDDYEIIYKNKTE